MSRSSKRELIPSAFELLLRSPDHMKDRYRSSIAHYLLSIGGVAGVTAALISARPYLEKPYAPLLYLLVVVVSATMAGVGPAILAALLSFICWNFFFIEPVHTFYVHKPNDLLALLVFLVVAVICGELAGRARRAGQIDALREADRLKSALLSSVSHDLRTPLATIKASVTNLIQNHQPLDKDSQRELLQSIDEASDQLNSIVGDLLDLSRIEAGVWEPGKELNDLSDVIGTVLERFDEMSNQRIVVQVPENLPLIPMDYVHVAQVLWNLLDNALKYSPPQSAVRVRATSDERFVTVSVIDAGPGINESDRERVFERFYRVRHHAEGRVSGTGMGLAICKGIVEAHGGRIQVRADGARGATFEFTLPL